MLSNWYKISQLDQDIVFENIHEDYIKGQNNYILVARVGEDKKPLGYIEYSEYEGILQISYIFVGKQYRRQGIGTALMGELERLNKEEFEGRPIKWGMLTEEGAFLRESLK